MRLLLDDRYAPITSAIGFLEAEYDRTVDAYYAWRQQIVQRAGETVERRVIPGPLARALEVLPPLTVPQSQRALLVPTSGAWTAYFDNGRRGTDPAGFASYLNLVLRCRGLEIRAVPDSLGTKSLYDKTKRGRYGSCSFSLNGPESSGERGNTIRAIYAANDSRWKFGAFGIPQPFEEPEVYKARRICDRFPFELLDKYCRALGVRPFDEEFYLPSERPAATLIEHVGPPYPREREFTLADVQAEWK